MVLDPDGNDVFALCPVTLWFFGTLVTEMMFRENSWAGGDTSKKGDIVKRVSVWSDNLLRTSMPGFVESASTPSFLSTAQNEWHENKSHSLTDLHIRILVQASIELLSGFAEGVGEKTAIEVGKWFTLMRYTTKSTLFKGASEATKKALFSVHNQFISAKEKSSERHHEFEHVFFHHKLLFLRVALQVCIAIKTNGIIAGNDDKDIEAPLGRIPHCSTTLLSITESEMVRWEKLSGSLVSKILRVDEHGIHIMTGERDFPSVWITLPYSLMATSSVYGVARLPSVTKVHLSVLTDLSTYLKEQLRYMVDVTQWEVDQLMAFDKFLEQTQETNIATNSRVTKCEKFRRSYYKKGGRKKDPIAPSAFARTTCFLGKHSFCHRFPPGYSNSSISSLPSTPTFDFTNVTVIAKRDKNTNRKRKSV